MKDFKVFIFSEDEKREVEVTLPLSEVSLIQTLYDAGITTNEIYNVWIDDDFLNGLIEPEDCNSLAKLNAIAYHLERMSPEELTHINEVNQFIQAHTLDEYLSLVIHHDKFFMDSQEPDSSIKVFKEQYIEQNKTLNYTPLRVETVFPIVVTLSSSAKPYRIPLPMIEDFIVPLSLHNIEEVESIVPSMNSYLQNMDITQLNLLAEELLELNEDQIIELDRQMHEDVYKSLYEAIISMQQS